MKTILITGSSSGIGQATTDMLLKKNYSVIGLARHTNQFNPNHPHYFPHVIDFAKIQHLESQLKTIQKNHNPIDAIVCCAGYGEFVELEQFSVNKIQELMNVNFLSQAILIKTLIPSLKAKTSGKIILLGSECALEGQKKGSIYCASKFALRGFAQSLRKECQGSNVAVTMINPGLVNTPFYDDLSFQPGLAQENSINADQIAAIITQLLEQDNNFVCEEINLQPMKKVVVKKERKFVTSL